MTVLENLLVAQHNSLMIASGFTFLGVLGVGGYRKAEKAAIEKAKLLARQDPPDRSRGRSGRRPSLRRAASSRDRPRHVHGPAAALPRRAGGRPQSARIPRAQRTPAVDPQGSRHLDPAHRARHVGGDGNLRSRGGARLRHQDFGRHARWRSETIRASSRLIWASPTKRSNKSRRRSAHEHCRNTLPAAVQQPHRPQTAPQRPRREDLLRQHHRAQRRRHGCERGRDRHPDRRQRGGQIHPDDDDLRQSPGAGGHHPVRRARHHPDADAPDRAAVDRPIARKVAASSGA